jgi:small subunit ribosomal protein S18
VEYIDYKDYRLLREMLTERGKIKPRGQTGTSAKFQRMLTTAIKRARFMALVSPTKL